MALFLTAPNKNTSTKIEFLNKVKNYDNIKAMVVTRLLS